jgi:hypothetical protein
LQTSTICLFSVIIFSYEKQGWLLSTARIIVPGMTEINCRFRCPFPLASFLAFP